MAVAGRSPSRPLSIKSSHSCRGARKIIKLEFNDSVRKRSPKCHMLRTCSDAHLQPAMPSNNNHHHYHHLSRLENPCYTPEGRFRSAVPLMVVP